MLAGEPAAAPLAARGEVLARSDAGVRWVRDGRVQRVAAALPELGQRQTLRDALGLGLIALVQFLRALTADGARRRCGRRCSSTTPTCAGAATASSTTRELLDHADAHGYHAAMAMIPLDAGRPNPATAALFRRRADRLSLVFHGNDHIKRELLAPADVAGARRRSRRRRCAASSASSAAPACTSTAS